MSDIIQELTPEELEKRFNKLEDANNFFTESFQSNLFTNGITKTIDETTIKKYFRNPEDYLEQIEKLTTYFYMSNPSVFQLYDMTVVLPNLSYKINLLGEPSKTSDKNKSNVNKTMKKVKYKSTTRDLLSQVITAGTLCGLWVGTKNSPYLYVFDDLKYIFPAYIKNNSWVVWVDLSWFDTMGQLERENMFDVLSPHITEEDYNKYKKDSTKVRYVELPQDKSVCLYTHKLYRNQRFGLAWSTQSFFDILHKEKLKALDKSISNKYINSVAVLSIGSTDQDGKFDYSKVGKEKGKKVYRGVKSGLEKSSDSATTVMAIPHWAKIVFPDVKTDGLDPEKYENVNDDLNNSTSGVINAINGKNNFSSSKITLDIMYKKIGVLLELIEEEVYQKLLNWILPNTVKDNYSIAFEKNMPLTNKEKITVLEKLNSTFGGSLKAVTDELEGVDFDEYMEQTRYEQEELKLPEIFKPYQNAFTTSGKEYTTGAPIIDDTTNENTLQSRENGGGADG